MAWAECREWADPLLAVVLPVPREPLELEQLEREPQAQVPPSQDSQEPQEEPLLRLSQIPLPEWEVSAEEWEEEWADYRAWTRLCYKL